jgi:hypothetical protein
MTALIVSLLNWMTANAWYFAGGVIFILAIGLTLLWILVDRKHKKAATSALSESGISAGDHEPNTIICDEVSHHRAKFSYVDYKEEPKTPAIEMPDGQSYYIFSLLKNVTELVPLMLPTGLRYTPDALYRADHDIVTGPILKTNKSIWEKAFIGALVLLAVAMMIFGMCILGNK